jgi:transcription-repair coupling factor (superfamily II helicase)
VRYADVTGDMAALLPDEYVPGAEAKLDIYRRLSRVASATEVEDLRAELRDRFGALPTAAANLLDVAALRVVGGQLGIEGVLVRGAEARVNFRSDAVPRMKGLSEAFHGVQFAAEVRRSNPLSLKLTRLGGSEMLDGLVRAFRNLS